MLDFKYNEKTGLLQIIANNKVLCGEKAILYYSHFDGYYFEGDNFKVFIEDLKGKMRISGWTGTVGKKIDHWVKKNI